MARETHCYYPMVQYVHNSCKYVDADLIKVTRCTQKLFIVTINNSILNTGDYTTIIYINIACQALCGIITSLLLSIRKVVGLTLILIQGSYNCWTNTINRL